MKSKTKSGPLAAVKVHERETDYCRERDVYFRLDEHNVTEIRGFHVPCMHGYGFDDDLWVLQMTIVPRPFVLDLGQAVLRELEQYGIFMVDVHPNNISFDSI